MLSPSVSDKTLHAPIFESGVSVNPSRWTDCLHEEPSARHSPTEHEIGILYGEGVGAEVIACCESVLASLGQATGKVWKLSWGPLIGRDAERLCGKALSSEALVFCKDVISRGGAILNGPGGGRYVYDLRKELDLFFKISPIQACNGISDGSVFQSDHLEGVDLLVTRENQGGVYQGQERSETCEIKGRTCTQTFCYSEFQIRRFLAASARLSRSRTGRMTVVWKESGVPGISALWKACAMDVAREFDVSVEMVDIDLMAYRLVREPKRFDVIATPNLFGDIIGDLGAALLGARGNSYSGNFNHEGAAIYQTNHGAAYDLKGTDRANPCGQLFSLAMLLRESFGQEIESEAIVKAVRYVWGMGYRTDDIMGRNSVRIGTRELGDRVAVKVAELLRSGLLPG